MKGKANPKQRKNALLTLLDDAYSLQNQPDVLSFLDCYIDCEATARKMVKFYKKDRYNKTTDQERINVREIANAAKRFNFSISRNDIYALFRGGRGIRGKKTPRQLRNAYVHAKTKTDVSEIVKKQAKHHALMERWLKSVNDYIHAQKEALA